MQVKAKKLHHYFKEIEPYISVREIFGAGGLMGGIISLFSPIVEHLGYILTFWLGFLLSAFLILGIVSFTKKIKQNNLNESKGKDDDEFLSKMSEAIKPKGFCNLLYDCDLEAMLNISIKKDINKVIFNNTKDCLIQKTSSTSLNGKIQELNINFLPDISIEGTFKFELNSKVKSKYKISVINDTEAILVNSKTKMINVQLERKYLNSFFIKYMIEFENDFDHEIFDFLKISLVSFKYKADNDKKTNA